MMEGIRIGPARKRGSKTRAAAAIAVLLTGIVSILSGCTGSLAAAKTPPAPVGADRAPTDPLATENARALLDWIYSLSTRSERKVLSGQDIGSLDGPQGYYDYVLGLYERTGKWPAMIGTDYTAGNVSPEFLDTDRKTRILVEYWRAGGLVTVYGALGNPWTDGNVNDTSTGSGDYSDAYTPGTPAYANLQRDFNRMAREFLFLQNAGVAILFRPFHEVNGKWFWWHSRDPEQFKQLWRHWYGYLTRGKGVHNLLFVFSPSGPPRLDVANPAWPWENTPWDYYPGDDCVDITGLSLYLDDLEAMPFRVYREMIAFGKPFGFGEIGASLPATPNSRNWDQRRIIRAIKKRYPAAVFWYSWSSWEPHGVVAMVDLPHAEELMSDPWVAAREDVDFPHAVEESDLSEGSAEDTTALRENREMKAGFIDYTLGQVRGRWYPFEAGWRHVQETLGAWLEVVPVRSVSISRFGKAVERLVRQEGCTMIFSNAHAGYDQEIKKAARRYPSVLFQVPQADQAARPANLRICGVDDSDAHFLMGAIAGAVTASGRIGFIGWVAENWQVVRVNEFALGVRATNPDARVFLRFADGQPVEAAKALLAEGCDVFNHLADHEIILQIFEASALEGKRIYTFGNWTPYEVHPNIIISSQPQDFGLLFERILKDTHAGKEVPRDLWMGIRDGAIRLKAGKEFINPAVAAMLRHKRVRAPDLGEMSAYEFVLRRFEQLRRGEYQPFTGPIKDQQGRLRLPEGVSNGTWEFRSTVEWLVDNVEGELPKR